MLKLIEVKAGNMHDAGKQLGVAIGANIRSRLKRFTDESLFRRQRAKLMEAHTKTESAFPGYVAELRGIAEGAGVEYMKLLFLNLPEINDDVDGCTGIACASPTETYLAHNEDSVGEERAEDCFLVHYQVPGNSFHAFCYAGELVGPAYGWNQHGVFYSTNYLEPIAIDLSGVSRSFLARSLLDAISLDDAIEKLRRARCASGYHHFIGQGQEVLSVEQDRRKVDVTRVVAAYVHSNHYVHGAFKSMKPSSSRHSRIRYKHARDMMKEGTRDPLHILSNRWNAPQSLLTERGEDLHTISTVHFLPRENVVRIYTPPADGKEPDYTFDLVSKTGGAS